MKKVKLDRRFMKLSLLLFGVGFLAGILTVNFYGRDYVNETGLLSQYFLKQYKYLEIDSAALFFYILEKKLKWLLLIWALGFTVVGVLCVGGYFTWFGYLGGVLLSIGVLKMGAMGIFFCVFAMLPQAIFTIPLWICFLNAVYRKASKQSNGGTLKRFRHWDWSYLFILLCGTGVLLLGILTESYINPLFMKVILKFF